MRHPDRARVAYVEGHAKRYRWRSVALVGVKDGRLARQFFATFPACKVLVVPVWDEPETIGLSARAQQLNHQRNLRVWARGYANRFTVDEGPMVKVAGRVGQFDGVVLGPAVGEDELPEVGRAWIGRVRDGGWLLGTDHRSERVRAILNVVAPKRWEHFRDGIWGVRVRRAASDEAPANSRPVSGDEQPAVASVGLVDDAALDAAGPGDLHREVAPTAALDEPVPALAVGGGETHADSSVAAPIVAPKRRGRPRKVKVET